MNYMNKIKLPNGTVYDLQDPIRNGIAIINSVGSSTTTISNSSDTWGYFRTHQYLPTFTNLTGTIASDFELTSGLSAKLSGSNSTVKPIKVKYGGLYNIIVNVGVTFSTFTTNTAKLSVKLFDITNRINSSTNYSGISNKTDANLGVKSLGSCMRYVYVSDVQLTATCEILTKLEPNSYIIPAWWIYESAGKSATCGANKECTNVTIVRESSGTDSALDGNIEAYSTSK